MPTQFPRTIVHVLGSFEVGGGEQVALNLAAAQVQLGHRVHVVSLTGGQPGPHEENFRRVGVLPHTEAKWGPTVDASLIPRLTKRFRRLGAHVVHTHNPLPLIYAGPAARLARVGWVHTKHGFNAAGARSILLRKRIGQFCGAFAAVSNQTARDALLGGDCRPDRLAVVKNGIDLAQYAPSPELRCSVRDSLGISSDAWVVGSVGRLSAVKNQALLVRAVAPLLGPEFRLVLVGDGPNKQAVQRAVDQCDNKDFIHLLGRRLDVPRIMPAFDVFALSSTSEGLPMVLPEAMACALPVVSTAVGGIPEVIDPGTTGWLVENGDEVGFRDKLAWLRQRPEQARVFGARARERALASYSLDSMVHGYMRLYAKLDTSD